MKSILLLAAVLSLGTTSLGYKILCLFPVPSRSHNTLAKGFIEPLLAAGHEVTWGTPYPDGKPRERLTVIDLSAVRPLVENIDMINHRVDLQFVMEFATNITTLTANTEALKQAVINTQFDAVITEWFFSDSDAGYAAVQKVPWIMMCSTIISPHMEMLVDEVRSVSTVPLMMTSIPVPMNLWDRVKNVFTYLFMWGSTVLDRPNVVARYNKHFAPLAAARGVTLPPFDEALYNISILFVNSHPSISTAQSLPPNVVEIAGYHINEETAPLPKDIQDILDASPQGVVYFSMGSVLKSSALPEKTRKYLIQMLGELPYTVLWKFEEEYKDMPKNVHIRKWWPQPSVLAHPNVKLFITHGGQLSSLEAIRYGVPLLAIPVYGDQPNNADRAVNNGYAKKVMFTPDMGPELKATLNEMLTDDRYYQRAKFLSKIFNNRPVSPHKLIAHYVELAIESKGAYHLRSKSLLYPWYERWMLDVIAALLAVIFLLSIIVKKLYRLCCRGKKNKVKKN